MMFIVMMGKFYLGTSDITGSSVFCMSKSQHNKILVFF